tara:strand:+ start:370 stop:597 length:228 start_codon:yes stop_codon:yes gene_type:complete
MLSHPIVVTTVFPLDSSKVLLDRVKLVVGIIASLGISGSRGCSMVLVDRLDLLLLLGSRFGHRVRDLVNERVDIQ